MTIASKHGHYQVFNFSSEVLSTVGAPSSSAVGSKWVVHHGQPLFFQGDVLVAIVWTVDIALSFLRGVTDRGAVDMRPTYVATKYLRTSGDRGTLATACQSDLYFR